jgi:DNA-binding transcriptional ArsR family regulator
MSTNNHISRLSCQIPAQSAAKSALKVLRSTLCKASFAIVDEADVIRLTDPRALRAYAHPVRMRLVSLLRDQGPLTATRAAELLNESSGTCSFHLRQLAKYGIVEEAGGGTGREKPWRATRSMTDVPAVLDDPDAAEAAGQVRAALAELYFDKLTHWLRRRPDEPAEWQEAASFGDRHLYLTATELAQLKRDIADLIATYEHRRFPPPGSREVTYIQLAFPS